jgi:hypothetical protein
MPKGDLWWRGPARIEIDQRSRDARRRLEQLEGLLAPRIAPERPRLG